MPQSNPGDPGHVPVETLWDHALLAGARLFAVASDDAHHYRETELATRAATGKDVYPGDLGWIMVRAERQPGAIRAALERGDFYATTGVLLGQLEVTPAEMRVQVAGPTPVTISCIGPGGIVRQITRGLAAACAREPGGVVRARLRADDGRAAWTQPVWD